MVKNTQDDTRNVSTEAKAICCPIFNQRLAGHLMQIGFVLMDLKPNGKCPSKNVFYFVDSASLKTAINQYLGRV